MNCTEASICDLSVIKNSLQLEFSWILLQSSLSTCKTRVSYIGRAKNMAAHSLVQVARIMGVLHR
jgi:hypothetical protein